MDHSLSVQQSIIQSIQPIINVIVDFLENFRDELDVYTEAQWSGFSALFSVLVLFSIFYGAWNLRQVSKKNRLDRCMVIFNELKEIEQDREDLVFNRLYSMENFIDGSEQEKKLQGIINRFNRITYYMENGHIDQEFVFDISCVNLIQCWYRLTPYVDYMTGKIGVEYAARVKRLDRMAKNYFDCSPRFHNKEIIINDGFAEAKVYSTVFKTDWKRIIQSIIWTRMYCTKMYSSWTLEKIIYMGDKR